MKYKVVQHTISQRGGTHTSTHVHVFMYIYLLLYVCEVVLKKKIEKHPKPILGIQKIHPSSVCNGEEQPIIDSDTMANHTGCQGENPRKNNQSQQENTSAEKGFVHTGVSVVCPFILCAHLMMVSSQARLWL